MCKKFNKHNCDSSVIALGEIQMNSSINMIYTLQKKIMLRGKEVDQILSYADHFARLIDNDTPPTQFKKSGNWPRIVKYRPRLLSTTIHQDMQPNDDDLDLCIFCDHMTNKRECKSVYKSIFWPNGLGKMARC